MLQMKFARWTFGIAGVYGLLCLTPQLFMEERVGIDMPPKIEHPEFFYGFLGVAIAWQLAFLVIARDPARYRLMMLPAVVEKYSFGIACLVLFWQARLNVLIAPFAGIDLLLGTLFIAAYLHTKSAV
ncbi:hypothetical protein ETAA8_37070 [Anatilimnocola aggregata]|uniref:Uncharacterized protein n=1 Tax=Anatilimnocola aggregata TaxID=2528021 RepID=A0A517YEF4_9BACT|nr:hypothetical protein [Anatilimnocola aggregata]QDU28604.1 hypothetical protein ETAA8_37070 [Anatilimnocola aggregata]